MTTTTYTTSTPVEIDEALVALWREEDRAVWQATAAAARVERADTPATRAALDDAIAAAAVIDGRIDEIDAEYAARPWARFFLVPDGHVHSSMHCSTCNKGARSTKFSLVTALSGSDEAHAVDEYGSMLCTVCFPSAPVEFTDGSRQGRIAREAADAKAADRAAKHAAKIEKALLPDGSPFPTSEGSVTTLIAAQRALTAALRNLADYGAGHPYAANWADDARRLAAAIAVKTGDSDRAVLAVAAGKAARKGYAIRTLAGLIAVVA